MGDVTLSGAVVIAVISALAGCISYLFRLLIGSKDREVDRIRKECDERINDERQDAQRDIAELRRDRDYYREALFKALHGAEGLAEVADRAANVAERGTRR